MGRLGCKPLLMLSLLVAVGCGGTAAVSEKGVAPSSTPTSVFADATVDTLCLYRITGWYDTETVHFRTEDQLTAFLKSTGYGDEPRWVNKKMAHQPDFKKWTYFAFVGVDFKHTVGIYYGDDTVTINYIKPITMYNQKNGKKPPPSVGSAPHRVIIYFIPSTEKTIMLADTMIYLKEKKP